VNLRDLPLPSTTISRQAASHSHAISTRRYSDFFANTTNGAVRLPNGRNGWTPIPGNTRGSSLKAIHLDEVVELADGLASL